MCQPCHYTCAQCQGPNDYQCRACHGDATLTPGPLGALSCLNTELLQRAELADRWYGGVLAAGVLLSIALVVLCLLVWRQNRDRARGYRALPVDYLAAGYTDAEPAVNGAVNGKPGGGRRPDVTVVRPLTSPLTAAETALGLTNDSDSDSGEESSLLGSAHS